MMDSMNRSPTIIPASSAVQDAYPEVTALGYRAHLSPDAPSVELDLSEEWNRLHERWRDRNPSEVATIPEIAAYAEFYERIGLDPTETPPSVQNLIER
jgi:DNA/RNA-binding domain of Phe-tRNA-synthetase-like protein